MFRIECKSPKYKASTLQAARMIQILLHSHNVIPYKYDYPIACTQSHTMTPHTHKRQNRSRFNRNDKRISLNWIYLHSLMCTYWVWCSSIFFIYIWWSTVFALKHRPTNLTNEFQHLISLHQSGFFDRSFYERACMCSGENAMLGFHIYRKVDI